jgi:PadR family transcriptional regulator PadR
VNVQFKKGVMELVVLSLLSQRDYYGFELVSEISKDIDISEGTIYPLLKRLRDDGQLETYLTESASGAPRKYYCITPQGRENKQLLEQQWHAFARSVERILRGEVQ